MKSYCLLTAYGQDHPGIVAGVTQAVFENGGNLLDASMTRLGGEFVMMLVVALPQPAANVPLLRRLPAIEKKLRLQLALKPISESLAQAKQPSQPTHLISVYGRDKPGIVYRTAQVLASKAINITDLHTRILRRSGRSLYVMMLEVRIPSSGKAAALRRRLKTLARALRLEITLQEIEAVSL